MTTRKRLWQVRFLKYDLKHGFVTLDIISVDIAIYQQDRVRGQLPCL